MYHQYAAGVLQACASGTMQIRVAIPCDCGALVEVLHTQVLHTELNHAQHLDKSILSCTFTCRRSSKSRAVVRFISETFFLKH